MTILSHAILGWDPEGVRCKIVPKNYIFGAAKRLFGNYKLNESINKVSFPGSPKSTFFGQKNGHVWTRNQDFPRFFGLFGWTSRHAWLTNLGGSILGHLLMGQFMPRKRPFWSRNGNYPRFFGLSSTSDGAWPSLSL